MYTYAFYFALFALAMAVTFSQVLVPDNGKLRVLLKPSTVLVFSFFVYTCAYPVSVAFFDLPLDELVDIPFMQDHTLAAFGLMFGGFIGRAFVQRDQHMAQHVARVAAQVDYRRDVVVLLLVGTAIFYNVTLYLSLGASFSNLFTHYGAEADFSLQYAGDNFLPLIGFPMTVGSLLVGLWICFTRKVEPLFLRIFIFAFSAIVVLIMLLRGSRNSAMLLAMPAVVLFLRGRLLAVRTLLISFTVAFIIAYTIGVVRNYGFGAARDAEITLATFAPAAGEFGTSRNIYRESRRFLQNDTLELGRTYYYDAIINLVPRILWRDRPVTTAERMTLRALNLDQLSEGLGFSPVVEAIANFSSYGILPVFILTMIIVLAVESYVLRFGAAGIVLRAVMVPIAFNWNRIDFCIVLKFTVVYGGFVVLFALCFLDKRLSGGNLAKLAALAELPVRKFVPRMPLPRHAGQPRRP